MSPQLTLGAHGIILLDCAFGYVVANQEIGVPGINAIINDFVSPQRELGRKTCGLVVNGSVCCTPQLTLGAHGIILLDCAFGYVIANREIGVPGINAIIKDFVSPQRELGV